MISIVINADTRPGQEDEENTVGDYGTGSLAGCRSSDYLTELPKAAHKFFEGHDHEVLLDVDIHEPMSFPVGEEIVRMMNEGWLHPIYHLNERDSNRWNDRIYLKALERANGDYVVHLDQDCAIFRHPDNDIVARYLKWLDEGYKFICQPTDLTVEQHGMWWASTRFFMCKRETLDFPALWAVLEDRNSIFSKYPWEGSLPWQPCLEHSLGVMAGQGKVLYPPREDGDEGYMVFSWVRYFRGLLQLMNQAPYEKVREFVFEQSGGIHGPNDLVPAFSTFQ